MKMINKVKTLLAVFLAGVTSVAQAQTDVTGYETVTVSIPATAYDAGKGAPQMARVKYNKTFPLVITSDDMGKTELTNNWAEVNGYPNVNNTIDLGIQPGGTKFLAAPYKKYYTQHESQAVADYEPMTYTDNVGKEQRYRMTSAIMPYDVNSNNYAKINAEDAKLMLRTGWSFAQHDVDNISSVSAISSAMTTNNTTWTNAVGIGLKVMVEPNGNHQYLDAGRQNSGVCWNIFQNPTSEYPGNSKALTAWTNSRTDWSASGITAMPSTFSSKPTGGYTRIFFQGHESEWKTAVDAADGSNIIIGGTHGLGDDIKSHLRTSSNVTGNAWVCGADEAWEYYHIYNNLKIENVVYSSGNLTFDVQVPTYQKNQFRELTLNIPGLTGGGTPTFSTASGKTVPVTGGYQQTSTSGIGYTMNIGLESSINTYIDQLMTIYRDDQTNAYVKRDLEYLISQLWDGTSYTSQLNANPTYDLTVQSSLGTTLATIKTDTNGDKLFAVPRYIVSSSKLYEHTANATAPYYVNTIATNSTPSAVSYAEKTVSGDAVLFVEGEDMTGATVVGADFDCTDNSSRYFAMRLASMGMGGCIVSGTPATVTESLPRGTYKMVIGYGNSSTGDTNYNVCVGGSSVYAISTSAVSGQTVTEFTTDDFDITVDNTPVTITSDYTNDHPEKGNRWIDYVYIIKTADLAAAVPTMTFTKSTAATTVKTGTTATLTATAVPNGGSDLTTSIYAADSESNISGSALATGSTDVTYDFTPSSDGTYYFVAQSTNSAGTTTSELITLTATSITNYTLNIVDKSGNTAMSTTIANPGSPAQTDPLPAAYRSPFAENYHYYLSATDAQTNNTANALASTNDWSESTIYVGYDVKSTFNTDRKFAIWSNRDNQYMHVAVRPNGSGETGQINLERQKYNIWNENPTGANFSFVETNSNNYALLDNLFMWQFGDDPYNITFKNVAMNKYANPISSSATASLGTTSTSSYCILYWTSHAGVTDTTTPYLTRVYYRGSAANTPQYVVGTTNNTNDWRVDITSAGNYTNGSKIYIKDLTNNEVTVNVLDSHGTVEAQIQAYNNSTAKMQSIIPYSMIRAYTSSHTLYYNPEHDDAVTASAVLNTSKLEANGGNLYMTYTLGSEWRELIQSAYTPNVMSFDAATDDNANWYGMRYNANSGRFLKANTGNLPQTTSTDTNLSNIQGNTDAAKQGQWTFIGTPYNLRIANRYHGFDSSLGIASDATSSTRPNIYASDATNVITTWEVTNCLNQKGTSYVFFRPQGGLNGQNPYLYLGNNNNSSAALVKAAGGGEMWYFYWAAETTEHYDPAATLTLSAASTDAYVDEATALTATATPATGHSVTYFAIERETSTDVWEVVGTAYDGSDVSGVAEKNATTGVVTLNCNFIPSAEGTYNLRARAVCDNNAENYTILSTNTARDGGIGSVVTITATVRPFAVGSDNYTLILVDKSGNELFTESNVPKSRVEATNLISNRNADPIDDSWRSPLVTRYYYYSTKADAQTNSGSNLFDWSSTDATPTVYVGYEVSDAIDLNGGKFSSLNDDANSLMKMRKARDAANNDNTLVRDASKFGKMYLLKFKTSAVYHSEDGSDKVEADETPAGTNVYPYTNGDGPMYIYTDSRYQDQKDNGASTRTRWPWWLVSPTGDPYHVYITSWQNSHANSGTNYYSYLRTFYQSGVGIVTNNVTDDPRTVDGNSQQIMPTEYMLLRADDSNGTYKLTTVAAIDNGTTTERRTVTSLEQYWRNNPTAQIQAGRSESNNGELTAAEKTTLKNKGWNNYNAYVNAAGWSGGTGSGNKSYANSEHWYQSIQVGNGSFDLVEANIDGVLVLLDNHGWEIMRQPIVAKDDPDYESVKAALRKFDSPMVSQYKFYSTRNVNHKVYGYHKFDIITNTGSKTPLKASDRVDADKTITSLADYEPHTSSGALTDLYVIYDVKPEYANSYVGAATEAETSASQFLVRQGSNYAKASGTAITTTTDAAAADNWYLKPNFNIDAEMGYLYNNGTANNEPSKADLETIYYNAGWNGFDPYNLRIQNVTTGTYFNTDASTATIASGIWTGNGSEVSLGDTATVFTAESYDNRTARVTNATFMAVQDGNGNMRLMPRFQHEEVVQGFTALAEQADDQPAGNTTHAQTTLLTTPVTYHIIDNSGADVFGALSYEGAGFAVPKEYQSPMVEQYYYHSTLEDAQTNRTTSNVTTVSPNAEIYVSYKVSDDFNANKAYNIWGSGNYMHASYRYTQTEDNTGNGTYIWWMRAQAKDREGGNDISTTTLPFLDNTYAWQVGENPDPYNVKFLNKGARRYINQENTNNNGRMEQLSIIETAGQVPATATPFCILYYGDNSDDCTLYNRSQSKYVYRNYGEWAANATRTGDDRRLTITELPAISINVVNAANEVECMLEGFYKSGCTWNNSFTPFYLQRIYTSGHTFYYTLADAAAGTNAISGTVDDATVTANGAVYVKYTLASDWGAAVDDDDLTAKKTAQTIKVMPSPSNDKINWYAVRTNNGKYVGASTTTTPANLSEATAANATADATTDASKLAQWALIGTPYNLKLVDRYHGMSNYLGISEEAAARSFAFIDDGTADITTWEVCTGYGNNAKLLIRPQRSLNGETPYLYIGWNGGAGNMSLAMSTGGNQGLNLTWVKETDSKTVTFKLYDKDGTYMSPTVSDFTLTGVSAGDDLAAAFGHTDLKRRFCQYTFYSSYDDQTQTLSNPVTEAGADAAETVYVKWEYTDYAPVFSKGSDVRDYQYYIMSVCPTGSIYPYIIGVDDDGSGGYDFKIDQNIGSIREHKHQFALVGNPYSFKLYSRYAGQYVGTPDQNDLLIDGNAEHDAVFDMQEPISEMNIVQFVARLKGTAKAVTGSSTDVWIGGANSGFLALRDIIIPVHVFKEGQTEQANQMDYREYAMDMTTHLSTDDRITASQLTETGNAIGTAHDFRHAFCDYTFYRGYDWSDGELSYLIPDEGLPYYGGQEQYKRQFFATYTIDHDSFDQIYLIKGSDGAGMYIGKDSESTHGYTLKGVNNKTEAKNDDTRSYRWQFTGDPYNLQIVNVGLGEFSNNYPLAVKAVSDGTTLESEASGTLALLTDEIPESSSDTESYGQYSHWEIIAKSDGNYVFWNIDEGEALRYTKSLSRHYAVGNGGVVRMTADEQEMILELPIERYAVTWHVMENDGSGNYSQVATEQVIVDENTTVVIEDMPTSLKRHFCEYNQMYSDVTCATAITSNNVTVTAATDVYVPYTLDSGAPDFLSATPTSSTAEKYWYEMGYPEIAKYIYYDTTNGVSSQTAISVSALRDFANYQYYRWALVGSPYSVKFYNKMTETYLTSDGDALTMGAEGTSFTLMDDYSGNLCAIYDAATGTYINASAMLYSANNAGGTAVDFSNTYGVVKIAFVFHYSANTLRQYDSNGDDVLDTSAANTTETIKVDTYQKLDKSLDDVLPKTWKRAFCRYSYDWGTTSTESTPSGTAVTTVSQAMVDAYNSNKDEYLYVHVTYDYTTDSPFKWSTATASNTDKYWYYLVNNHRPNGELGKMVYRDSDPKLRVSLSLVNDRLYLNNFEWCVIGDPYGFKLLNRYDPDQRFDEYISVTTDDIDSDTNKPMLKQVAGNSNCLFEMMPGQYSYNFWMHPVYTAEQTNMEDEFGNAISEFEYVGNNSNGSAAVLMTAAGTALRTNASANFRLEVRSNATLKEYLNYAGFVGALKYDVANGNAVEVDGETVDVADIKAKLEAGTATDEEKEIIHNLINDPDNMVNMVQGYYRLIPYTWENNKSERRYVRGYLDDRERTASSGYNSNLKVETQALAEYDPASIFWFESTTSDGTENGYPRYNVKTQGLNLTGNGLSTEDGFKCSYEGMGAAIMQLKTSATSSHEYLSCAGGDETSTNQCFDEQAGYYKTRFYMQKVGEDGNELAFKMKMSKGHNGTPLLEGNESYGALPYTYTSICVPYDLEIIGGKDAVGKELALEDCDMVPFIGTRENYHSQKSSDSDTYYNEGEYALMLYSVDLYNSGDYAGSKRFIPAGTPVVFRSMSGMTDVHFQIPTSAPSESLSQNSLDGSYLKITDTDASHYIFGKESKVVSGTKYYTGRVGFFPRTNPTTLSANKVYYAAPSHATGSRGVLFTFASESPIATDISDMSSGGYGHQYSDGAVYDLQGRKVADSLDSARSNGHLLKGVYIINGKKIVIK